VRYLVWAQAEPGIDTNSNLYLARMSNPWTITGTPTRLAVPTLAWERRGGVEVNEGPAVIQRNGKVFMTFSASATDANYCLGLLTARRERPAQPASWTKTPTRSSSATPPPASTAPATTPSPRPRTARATSSSTTTVTTGTSPATR
jgi:GH43 family beta-xylosidase